MSYLLIKISNYLGLSIVYSVFEYVDRFESCPIKKVETQRYFTLTTCQSNNF